MAEPKPSLRRILDDKDADASDMAVLSAGESASKAEQMSSLAVHLGHVPDGCCVECEERAATQRCRQCDDLYCAMCFQVLHRRGQRTSHTFDARSQADIADAEARIGEWRKGVTVERMPRAMIESAPEDEVHPRFSPGWFRHRAKFIPVRLNLKERKLLRMVQGSLSVCKYTDLIDAPALMGKPKRVHKQMQEICAQLTGFVLAVGAEDESKELMEKKNFDKYPKLYRRVFEIARRHKVMNPEKMRTQYGKLVYLLQDAMSPQAIEMLNFKCVKSIRTVYTCLEEADALALLADPNLATATREILPGDKTRQMIQREIKEKERAQEIIARKYQSTLITADTIKTLLYSIGDNFSFLTSNRDPIDCMITYLKEFFRPDVVEDGYSLAISSGNDGARLTHNHSRHYNYVLQSLTLWREIADDMFRLWYLAEQDLLADNNPYVLTDTGQGLNRVQAAPRILSAMRSILHKTQQSLGDWVGSSVIHLGDKNVPNALVFIDKYTQIAKILAPINLTLRAIDTQLMKTDGVREYINEGFGGPRKLKHDILYDFFRFGFDGSGADNFFDAGSCIDGRLTSAWNWCSLLPQKPFYPIFKLAGNTNFDGEFQE